MCGWIKLHRQIEKSHVWRSLDAVGKVILITLLLRAAHQAMPWQIGKQKQIILETGELFISVRHFAAEMDVKESALRNVLKLLLEEKFIITSTGRSGTKIKILNWEKYQQTPANEFEVQTSFCAQIEAPLDEAAVPPSSSNNAAEKTAKQTPFCAHNKNYINNNYNNKIKNSCFKAVLGKYQKEFGMISTSQLFKLTDTFSEVPEEWLDKSLTELLAASEGKCIKVPTAYWIKILQSWKASGQKEPWLKTDGTQKKSNLGFYLEGGVI